MPNPSDRWEEKFDKNPVASIAKLVFFVLFFGLAITWTVQGSEFFMYQVFAPRMEEVRREVFEQTQSYVQGKNTYIARLRMQYETTDEVDRKEALRRLILSETETIDNENLTNSNREFVTSLRTTEETSR